MKLLVYEHMSGGGYAGQPISPYLLAEGFAMLRSIVSDYKAAGHEITILLDNRILKLNPPVTADRAVPVFYPQEAQRLLNDISRINDATYVIAPESGQTLQSLVELVQRNGKISLNCESSAIQKVADKASLYETLENNHLPTPKTALLNINADLVEIKQVAKSKFSYPVVFKPIDGVGCSGLSIVQNDAGLQRAVTKIKRESAGKRFIIQELVDGEAASVSLLSSGDTVVVLSLNQQIVKIAPPEAVSSYEGGTIPYDHPAKQKTLSTAEKVVNSFPGLKGYVGVDLILTDKPFVVDVNPRLTTSYVGLSRISNYNIAEAIVSAKCKGQLPTKLESHGVVCFSKLETPRPKIEAFKKTVKIRGVVSPPFPLNDNEKGCSLISAHGSSLTDAQFGLEEAKKCLLNIVDRGN